MNLDSVYEQLAASLTPDLDLDVATWSDRFMVIPKSTGSHEYGPYRTQRTPHAKKVMLALSDDHDCKRVVAMCASQLFKTQVALNWFSSTVHQSPSNFLWLMPTGMLAKRIAARIDKTIAAVPVLNERVAKPKSRDALNNQNTKEYIGGTLFIATAGSAANLSEVPARRVAFDEIDRADVNVDDEGDPVKLAESRQTTFAHNKKSYYYSSPNIKDESRIEALFQSGTQRRALAECIHCGHAQELIFENLRMSEDGKKAMYPCEECGGLHEESDKTAMFKNGLWSDGVEGDGETESFTASAMYLPYGWLSWRDLMREHAYAHEHKEAGNDEFMKVFYNTRLARCWERTVEVTTYSILQGRAEPYKLRIAPHGVLFITAGVDTQDNRLAVQIIGWGRGLRAWVLDYIELPGDPADDKVWDDLTALLNTRIQHECGATLPVRATAIDIGGHRGEAVKYYVRTHRITCPIAINGASTRNAMTFSHGRSHDVNKHGKVYKKGVIVHSINTTEIKHIIFPRLKNDADKEPDDRMIRFSKDLEEPYFVGLVSEKYDRKEQKYKNKPGVRNEPLDTFVYAYAALYHKSLRAYMFKEVDWRQYESDLATGNTEPGKKISLTAWKRA